MIPKSITLKGIFLSLSSWALIPYSFADQSIEEIDVLLVGSGIMSATLGSLLEQTDPNLKIMAVEKLPQVSAESSDAPNNAGTGHAALCELNYTPLNEDGSIDISKALKIMEKFEISKQFWAYLVAKGIIKNPQDFIHPVPHISFVRGEKDIAFLKKRFEALKNHPFFADMEYSEDPKILEEWMPLVMKGRNPNEKVAATRSLQGTDLDFGKLSRILFDYLTKEGGLDLVLSHDVVSLKKSKDADWIVTLKNLVTNKTRKVKAKFVFIGAGGGALPLLQKAAVPEAKGYGGFPIAGQFLVSKNHDLIEKHNAKVYGKASEGSPPMSVPHLDTRIINGRKELLFGPFAGFSTKFLKKGSHLDLFKSLTPSNLPAMLKSAIQNIPLIQYLFAQITLRQEDRIEALREFFPNAAGEDWELIEAGQRVQIIKDDPGEEEGVLRFGTEVINTADGSLSALLGASPGASVSVSVILKVIEQSRLAKSSRDKISLLIPSYNIKLSENETVLNDLRDHTNLLLQLNTDSSLTNKCETDLTRQQYSIDSTN